MVVPQNNTELPHDPELKAGSGMGTCAALFSTAKGQKQPRRPPADGWMNKLWFVYTTEYQ